MTGSKNYDVAGALVTITANTYPAIIEVCITVDTSPLDVDEPDYSPHQLIGGYLDKCLPSSYKRPQSYWWCKRNRKIMVKSASQARRVIKKTLTKLDDAISTAKLERDSRKRESDCIFE